MIDELDQKLILELQRNSRVSYSNLAKILGVSEGTVRQRFKKLTKSEIIKAVAVPNVSKLGYSFISIVAIQVRMAELDRVRETLSQNPAVCQLVWVTGRYDLIAIVVTQSTEEFANFMVNELSAIPSVVRTETFVSLGMVKGAVSLADTSELINTLDIPSPKKTRG